METQSRPKIRRASRYRESWHTRRRLRCPEKRESFFVIQKLDQALNAHAGREKLWSAEGERVYLPDEVYGAFIRKIELFDLPYDRYHIWCGFGKSDQQVHISSTLCDIELDEKRIDRLVDALLAIEPYPSKKPIERFQISRVLRDVGDVWQECNRVYHESN
jgi:hypothetical protein